MIFLKKLNLTKDISSKYLFWMNDIDVQKYTEQKYFKTTLKDIKKYVLEKNKSKNEFLYGIFLKQNKLHIGNIKLGPINCYHQTADISYFIGDKIYWNKNFASLAIQQIIKIAKKKKVKKIKAGCYAINKGSIKVLKKNGFKLEGKLKSEIKFNNKRCDGYIFGKIL